MFHKFMIENTKPPATRPTELIGFFWSTQAGTCFIGRKYDGSKFRFRNWAKAMRLRSGKGTRKNKAERVAEYKELTQSIRTILDLPSTVPHHEAIKKLTGR